MISRLQMSRIERACRRQGQPVPRSRRRRYSYRQIMSRPVTIVRTDFTEQLATPFNPAPSMLGHLVRIMDAMATRGRILSALGLPV